MCHPSAGGNGSKTLPPPRQLMLRCAQGSPETGCLISFDFLIAEDPQVPWVWLQNSGMCESQPETQFSSQCSSYAPHGVCVAALITTRRFRRVCLPVLLRLFLQQIFLEHFLRVRPHSRCGDRKQTTILSSGQLHGRVGRRMSVNRKTNKTNLGCGKWQEGNNQGTEWANSHRAVREALWRGDLT